MSATHGLMGNSDGSWEEDDRLNDTDRAILNLLANGRETTKSLADNLKKHPQTVRDRIRWLKEWNYVETYHENAGLHELRTDNDSETDE